MTAALQVNSDTEESVVSELRRYVRDNFSLSELSDDELFDSVSRLVIEKTGGTGMSIDEQVGITESVYSSIRGFGVLDMIMKDDSVTEVMINGYDSIWI